MPWTSSGSRRWTKSIKRLSSLLLRVTRAVRTSILGKSLPPNRSAMIPVQMVGVTRDHNSTRSAGFLRAVGFWVDLRPLCVSKAVDPTVFLGGHDHRHVAVLPTNEHGFVLYCVEERAEAFSGGGNGNSLHIHLIDKTQQMPQEFGTPAASRDRITPPAAAGPCPAGQPRAAVPTGSY
jgi:hypothetical protein